MCQICLVFFCKAGRHRSFALMIAFLMWASHVHAPQLWANLISPIRNKHLMPGFFCELLHQADLTEKDLSEGIVPFASVLHDYATFLDSEFPSHAWPLSLAALS